MNEPHEPSGEVNATSGAIVDIALAIHREFGPGLCEEVYDACLTRALVRRGHRVERQVSVPLKFEGELLPTGLKIDLVVDGAVIVEVKSVERVLPLHQAQVLTYLELSGRPVALLLNFNTPRMKDGIFRFVRTVDGSGHRSTRFAVRDGP